MNSRSTSLKIKAHSVPTTDKGLAETLLLHVDSRFILTMSFYGSFSEKFVLPFRPKDPPVYYHRRFNRVPTIDQCEIDDPLCRYEADAQFKRDK